MVAVQCVVSKQLTAHSRSAEQHEQDMLEELDRMHEECAALHDDARVSL